MGNIFAAIRLFICVCIFVLCLGIQTPVFAENVTHPFTIEDQVSLHRILGVSPSPDGRLIVFPVQTPNLTVNKGEVHLWIIRADGSDLHQITMYPGTASDPCWSPDSRTLYYLSTQSGSSQVWKMTLPEENTEQITNESLDISNLIISSDGKQLAFSMEVIPGKTVTETAAYLSENDDRTSSGRVYESLPVRHWDSWEDGRRNHIFVMPLITGKPVDIMNGMKADCPSKPFGGTEEFIFTPDCSGIVFSAADNGREEAWSTNHDLYLGSTDGTTTPVNLTPGNQAEDNQPVFSPDGKKLSYLAQRRPGYESDRYHIMVKPWREGDEKEIMETWDYSPSTLFWSADGDLLYAIAFNKGQRSLFAIDVLNETAQTVIENGDVAYGKPLKNAVIYGHSTFTEPADLFVLDQKNNRTTRLTSINQDRLRSVRMGTYEPVSYTHLRRRRWYRHLC